MTLINPIEPIDFIEQVKETVMKGWGIVPFTGAGISARSGITMGMHFDEYLTWMIFRCVASPENGKYKSITEKRWIVRQDGWATAPNTDENTEVKNWVLDKFTKLCERHDLNVNYENGKITAIFLNSKSNSVGTAKKRRGSKDWPQNSSLEAPALDVYLRRPLVPAILRNWKQSPKIDDEGVKNFLRLLSKDNIVSTVLTYTGYSNASIEVITELAIRSLHDWRAMLDFLSRLHCRPTHTTAYGDKDDVSPCMVERDASVIDSFNLHVTRGKKPNLAHTMLCHLASPLRSRVFLTTNFDALQKDAFEQLGEHYEVIPVSVRGELPSADTVHSLNCIVKLHGALTETRADYSLDTAPSTADC